MRHWRSQWHPNLFDKPIIRSEFDGQPGRGNRGPPISASRKRFGEPNFLRCGTLRANRFLSCRCRKMGNDSPVGVDRSRAGRLLRLRRLRNRIVAHEPDDRSQRPDDAQRRESPERSRASLRLGHASRCVCGSSEERCAARRPERRGSPPLPPRERGALFSSDVRRAESNRKAVPTPVCLRKRPASSCKSRQTAHFRQSRRR